MIAGDRRGNNHPIAGRLGHSDPSTTLRVYAYAHARNQRDVELATSLGEALRR